MPEGTHIDLKEGTLGIARSAFDNCSGLTSITIPNSVTSIGYSAFSGTAWYNNQPDGLVYAGKVAYKYKGTMPEGTEIVIKDGTLGITASAFSGCTSLTSVTIPNSVTTIGNGAFSNCSGLTSISIPNSVSRIGEWSFEYCTGLESVTMSENVTTISNSIFSYCSALKAITIPNSVTSIGQNAFYNCSGLTSVTIGNSVTSIGGSAFVGCIRLTSITIPNSVASIGSNAFPSATKIYVDKGASALIAVWNYCRSPYDLSTNTLLQIPTISKTNNCASSLQLLGSSSSNGVQFTNESFTVDGVTKAGHSVTCTGLRPNTSYPVQYSTTVTYGGSSSVYTRYDYFKTSSLLLTLSTPKVISLGNVIVAATSNLDDEEENVGFEWRRMDWSDDMLSNTGAAYMYEGTMEGYIRSLNTNYYWKVRPYYKSNDGTYYYGEWGGFDPTNTSYFEPTVHTYAKINVTGNKAHVSGYVQRASDAVIRQGFKYWIQEDNAREAEDNARGAGVIIPSSAKTVEAEGRIMEAVFTNLQYNTTYTYVAFVTTTEGETFYGKQQAFTTGEDPDATILGDANDSGEVEIGDITSVLTLMANPDAPGYNNEAADANQSGEIEIGDITTILTIMANGE